MWELVGLVGRVFRRLTDKKSGFSCYLLQDDTKFIVVAITSNDRSEFVTIIVMMI